MAHYIQQSNIKGPQHNIQCTCCRGILRGDPNETLEHLEKRFEGWIGIFEGNREYLCMLCIDEHETGTHITRWRW